MLNFFCDKLYIRVMRILVMTFIFVGLGHAYSQELELEFESEADSLSAYYIDGIGVGAEIFDSLLLELKQIRGSWYCDDMSDGGQTGYDAKDKKGNVYSYYCLTHPRNSHCSIEKQKK